MNSLALEYLLITVGNKERKTNLFVPYFIFMRWLRRQFDWHRWYMLSAFFRSSWGFRLTYHSLLCYQGLLWLSKLCCDELPTWEFLRHLNPSLTEIPWINNLPAPMPNASGSVDRDLWQLSQMKSSGGEFLVHWESVNGLHFLVYFPPDMLSWTVLCSIFFKAVCVFVCVWICLRMPCVCLNLHLLHWMKIWEII